MDFIDQLKQLATRADQLKDKIATEEATKTSLILPFFQLLGYDVFNPMEFVPEYTADVGIKKGERVDYAILQEEKPVILIEAKWCGEALESHDSQLFRYFGTTPAKFAILTNGLTYRFYTDLDESNKMDLVPFMEFDIQNIKEEFVPELKKFQKSNLDIDAIFSSASDLKYSNAIKQLLTKQLNSPEDAFINYLLSEVYTGRHTQPIIDKFRDIVKRALTQWVNNILNEKFQNAMQNAKQESTVEDQVAATETIESGNETTENSKIVTSLAELEAYVIVKTILHENVNTDCITYKDTESYLGILYNGNTRKWICRLFLEGAKKSVVFPDTENANGTRYYIDGVNDLYQYKEKLLDSVNRFMQTESN
jgi:predicted type IV restriction endonuclease